MAEIERRIETWIASTQGESVVTYVPPEQIADLINHIKMYSKFPEAYPEGIQITLSSECSPKGYRRVPIENVHISLSDYQKIMEDYFGGYGSPNELQGEN